MKDIRISKVNPQAGDIIVINPKIKGQAVIPGQAGDSHTGGGSAGQRNGLAECPAVHIICRAVLGIEGPVEAGAVGVVAVEVLEAQGIRVIRDQLVVCHVIVQVQTGHFGGREGGAVAAVLQLVVIDVGHVPDVAVILVVRGIIGVIDGDKGGGILDVHQIVLVCAVVNGDVIAAVVLVVVEVILGVIVFGERGVIVIVGGIIVVPGFEIRAVGILIVGRAGDVIGGVVIQKVREPDVGLVIVRVIGGIVDGVEGLVVAVDDFHVRGVAATVVVGYIAVLILHAAGGCGVIFLGLISSSRFSFYAPHHT